MKIRSLKANAAATLVDNAFNPRLLAFLHTGLTLLVSLVLMVLNYVISDKLDAATGLAQLDNRALLQTVLTVASLAVSFLTPFWEVGFLYAALRMARSSQGQPSDLLEGFRRWGPVLRLNLIMPLIFVILLFSCSYPAFLIFVFTPFSAPFVEMAMPIVEEANATGQLLMDEAMMEALLPTMVPYYIILGILFAGLGIPLFYRFRMAQYAIMDDARGAFSALLTSSRVLRKKRFFLFRLDLSFWWFFALQALITLIANIDILLTAFDITLPVSREVMFFAPFLIATVLQLVLAWCYVSYVQTTYTHCYDQLKAALPPKPQPAPKQTPWQPQ